MSAMGYRWRHLNEEQRGQLLAWRKERLQPWHSPPHWKENFGHQYFHLTGACWQHEPRIGHSAERMEQFTSDLVATLTPTCESVPGWCVLPNHYHVLIQTKDLQAALFAVGRLHGRTSHAWNREENTQGRSNFYRCIDRAMRSDAHQWSTLNYIHHNPVRHGYVKRWTEGPYTSAHNWLEHYGHQEMKRVWLAYPVLDYGQGWDEPNL